MISTKTESFAWSADAAGMILSLRTPEARKIAESVKQGRPYTVEIKEYRKKRSLDQNALYWGVLTQFAQAMHMSNSEAHNRMLRDYGTLKRWGDKLGYVVLPDTDEVERQTLEDETEHLKPTSQVKEGYDGQMYRTYMVLKGSSSYDTAEMTRLLDGLIAECKEIGIDVLTEQERSLLEDLRRNGK